MTTNIKADMKGLAGAAEAMIAGSAKNLSQLLSASVEFNLLDISNEPTSMAETIEGDVHLSVEFDGALAGNSWLILTEADAKAIVTTMTQDVDISEDALLGEAGMSALSEAMNQLMAGAAAALSNGLGERIDISPPTISMNPEPQPERDNAVIVTYESKIADQASSKVVWEVGRELAQDLDTRWLANAAAAEPPPGASAVAAPSAEPAQAAPVAVAPQPQSPGGVIDSVELDVAVELGNVELTIGELLRLGEGSVVTLTQSVGDDVVMLANGTPVASGEVVVVDGTLGFRVSALVTQAEGA